MAFSALHTYLHDKIKACEAEMALCIQRQKDFSRMYDATFGAVEDRVRREILDTEIVPLITEVRESAQKRHEELATELHRYQRAKYYAGTLFPHPTFPIMKLSESAFARPPRCDLINTSSSS